MKAWVYILKNASDRFYIGSTDDVQRRLKQHLTGSTQTTRNMGTFELVLTQGYDSLRQARKVERKLKNLKRKDYIEKIVKEGYIRIVG